MPLLAYYKLSRFPRTQRDLSEDTMKKRRHHLAAICRYGNCLMLIFLALYFLLIPLGIAVLDLTHRRFAT